MSGIPSVQACCRLCLCDKTDTLVSVFGAATEDRSLSQKILAFVAVQITASDKLSTMVCSPCVSQLECWQKYKEECEKNQNKLEQLLHAANVPGLHDMSIQIKEEPPDEVEMLENESGLRAIKPERIDEPEVVMEEDFDYPPPLTPYNQHPIEDDDSQISQTSQESQNSSVSDSLSGRMCSICDKSFSTSYNRRKHEKHIHGILETAKKSSVESATSNDEVSQNSIESQKESHEKVTSDAEQQKIAFAAGLKLLQTNETPIAFEPLSKVEFSYIEKCKAMIKMYKSRVCACHNVSYNNLKGLLSHLRSLNIWFPVFTCYHCMITYTDRSSFTRHHLRFHKNSDEHQQGTFIEGLIKLSNLRKRSDLKTRLYQNFRCSKCRFIFSFHEEFINHINEDHIPDTSPICICNKTFSDIEEYKKHVYVSCLLEYYCDICTERLPSAEAFIKHAAELHDNSEGFSILQEDTVKQRRSATRNSVPSPSLIVRTKRRSSFYKQAPVLEPELEMDEMDDKKELTCKVKNPASQWKRKPTKCLACEKVYSSYANMMRHYKTHNQLEQQSSEGSEDGENPENAVCYSCPDCGGMYNATKWQKHLREHHKTKSCPDCERVFQFQTELDQHRTIHLNLKVYRDSKTKSYKSAVVNPNSEAGIIHICDRCETTFATVQELQAHKLLHETMPQLSPNKDVKLNEFECKDCDVVFNGYRQLWEHDRSNHPEKRTPQSKNFPKQCKYCDKLFYTGGSYSNHKIMHERSGATVLVAKAAEPSKAKNKQSNKESDEDDEAGESYHTCNKCFKVFASKSQLRSHAKSHTKSTVTANSGSKGKVSKKVWCDSCHVSCENAEALEKHRLEEHVVKKETIKTVNKVVLPNQGVVFTCDVCVMTFSTKIALKRHKERHAQEIRILSKTQTVYCKFCKIPFESVPLLNKHMQTDHKNELEQTKVQPVKKKIAQYSCDICNKNFQSPTALYVHQGWHRRTNYGLTNKQGKTPKSPTKEIQEEVPKKSSFQCNTCEAELPNNTALQIHILEKHRNVDAIILTLRCNTCKTDFKTQEEYENHKRLHDFLEKQQQNVHLSAVPKQKAAKQPPTETNPTKPKHICQHCGTQFTRVDNLAVHMRTIHNIVSGEFKCTQCDRVFDKQMSLTIHLKVHEKQKSLTGTKCEKPALKPKITNSNAKTAAYCCSICNMGFDLPKDLRTHTINSHPF